jgi:SAM-dependent methyltransferase
MNVKTITNFINAPDIESSTRDYAGRFSNDIGQWLLSHQIEATRKAITDRWPDTRGLSVLDVGGGHGQNIDLIYELGHQLTVVGSDQSCTEVIKDQIESGKTKFDVAPLMELPYADNSFDIVICYRILSHMQSWQVLIGELTRIARHIILVDYPSRQSVNYASEMLFAIKKKIEKNARPFNCFDNHIIDDEFLTHGYLRSYQYKQFFMPMAFYRLLSSVGIASQMAGLFRKIGLTNRLGSPVISGYSAGE